MSKLIKFFLGVIIFAGVITFVSAQTGGVISSPGAPPNDWLSYAKFAYPFAISVGAILAVIMLIIAGLQMMTASESMRSAAKEKIQNALIGLFLLLGIYIILNTINPALLNLKIDTSGLKYQVKPPAGSDVGGAKDFPGVKNSNTAPKEGSVGGNDNSVCTPSCTYPSTCVNGSCTTGDTTRVPSGCGERLGSGCCIQPTNYCAVGKCSGGLCVP